MACANDSASSVDLLYLQYQKDYLSATQALKQSLNGRPSKMSPEALLDEVKLMVGKLKMEARALPAHTASQKLQEVRGYEAHVRQLEAQVRSGLRAGDRAELLGQRADGALPGSASQRDRLLQSTQKLDKSGERIQQSRQMVADMEAQGAAILQNLHGQRETIQRSQQKLHEADQNISSSQKILRRMGRWLPF